MEKLRKFFEDSYNYRELSLNIWMYHTNDFAISLWNCDKMINIMNKDNDHICIIVDKDNVDDLIEIFKTVETYGAILAGYEKIKLKNILEKM